MRMLKPMGTLATVVVSASALACAGGQSSAADTGAEGGSQSGTETGVPTPGTLSTLAGPIVAGSGGVVVDSMGRIYTADFGSTLGGGGVPGVRIHRVDPETGRVSIFAEGFEGASGNALGADGTLYQSNVRGNTISRVATDGAVATFATGLVSPVGIAVAPGDTLYVANCGDNSIARVDPAGTVTQYVASPLLQCPNGIAQTESGDLYVANFSNGDVVRIAPNGEVSVLATVPGNNNGHITYGNGVFYVVARSNHQLYALTLAGELTLIAGTGERGQADGPALAGTLSLPNDLGLSPDGRRLYFNDVAADAGNPGNLSPVYIRVLELGGT